MKVDLHCHSTNSDGTWSVQSILNEVEKKGVKVLSITDHDNFEGSLEAFRSKIFSGILVPGIEISTEVLNRSMHFLAFFPDFETESKSELLDNLNKIKNSRVWRMKEMIKRAQALNMDVTWEEVLEEAGKGDDGSKQPTDIISRPHLARVLIKKGIVKDFDDAFDRYLADGQPLHVSRFSLEFDEWVTLVTKLGGIMIWAHPFHGHKENLDDFKAVLKIVKQSKVIGVEKNYNYRGKYPVSDGFISQCLQLLEEVIQEKNWIITAGGDFHGNVGSLGEMDLDENNVHRFLDKLGIKLT